MSASENEKKVLDDAVRFVHQFPERGSYAAADPHIGSEEWKKETLKRARALRDSLNDVLGHPQQWQPVEPIVIETGEDMTPCLAC